ncbi:MAG: GNAT family N-acetyltransferase [Desulfobacteraceae bacterium]|nr:MAG: GNAT family N-acetyltransferase [Desulfobacteraceae bacterium]
MESKARQWSNSATSAALLIMEKEKAMGLASCYRDPDDPAQCILGGMWVHPDLRGTNRSTELVANFAQWARERGFRAMTAWVTDVNGRARRFYEKAGFILQAEERVHANNADFKDLLMIKVLL